MKLYLLAAAAMISVASLAPQAKADSAKEWRCNAYTLLPFEHPSCDFGVQSGGTSEPGRAPVTIKVSTPPAPPTPPSNPGCGDGDKHHHGDGHGHDGDGRGHGHDGKGHGHDGDKGGKGDKGSGDKGDKGGHDHDGSGQGGDGGKPGNGGSGGKGGKGGGKGGK